MDPLRSGDDRAWVFGKNGPPLFRFRRKGLTGFYPNTFSDSNIFRICL
jgi:hypothetical protein